MGLDISDWQFLNLSNFGYCLVENNLDAMVASEHPYQGMPEVMGRREAGKPKIKVLESHSLLNKFKTH